MEAGFDSPVLHQPSVRHSSPTCHHALESGPGLGEDSIQAQGTRRR